MPPVFVTRKALTTLALACSVAACASGGTLDFAATFQARLDKAKDLEYPGLLKALRIEPDKNLPLPFDPTQARYYNEAAAALGLVEAETKLFKQNGFVVVDHDKGLSMAEVYLEIYHADLPVFVSTDSILHALHRSYDRVLMELEEQVLVPNLDTVLAAVEAEICPLAHEPGLGDGVGDLAVFVTVARNLLAGVVPAADAVPKLSSACADAATVNGLMARIASLEADDPEKGRPATSLYGTQKIVDWSQFRPRGHYVKSPQLQAYFRAMMWIGRVDLAWDSSHDRELRDSALLVLLVAKSGQVKRLAAMSRLVDFMVGRADSAGPAEMQAALNLAHIDRPAGVASSDGLASLRAAMGKVPLRTQQIRSQSIRMAGGAAETPLPAAFQVFGQRFVLDAFVLSKVVYDSIVFHGEKSKRRMPSGLDVMAALGSNEAVVQLEPQIRRYNYAANLLAARQLLDGLPEVQWQSNAYVRWLDALRKLYPRPESPQFPHVMRSSPWQRKQLQTTLASWAELRHDTILYAKQSYGGAGICEYPEGYVEPYPAFFAALGELARQTAEFLGSSDLEPPDRTRAKKARIISKRQSKFFDGFAKTMRQLETIARKELQALALDADEKKFLKDLIVKKTFVGCVKVTSYTGWYPQLIYDDKPTLREPTVADVHSDPESGSVLEEGVGDARYLVIAIDNQQDRAVYIGPAYSYYEFTSPTRLTDEEWDQQLPSTPPPPFTAGFATPAAARSMRYPIEPPPAAPAHSPSPAGPAPEPQSDELVP